MITPIVISIILAAIHFFGSSLSEGLIKHRDRIISFGSGIAISYLFLWLLPETFRAEVEFRRFVFAFVLLGFITFHIAEKYFYEHDKSLEQLRDDLKELHSLAFFVYYFLLGLVFVELARTGERDLLLFSIPIVVQSVVTSTSIERIHEKLKDKPMVKLYLSLAPVFGLVLGFYTQFSHQFFQSAQGFVVGMLFYTFIRDDLPKGKKGDVSYFVLGSILYSLLIFVVEWGI